MLQINESSNIDINKLLSIDDVGDFTKFINKEVTNPITDKSTGKGKYRSATHSFPPNTVQSSVLMAYPWRIDGKHYKVTLDYTIFFYLKREHFYATIEVTLAPVGKSDHLNNDLPVTTLELDPAYVASINKGFEKIFKTAFTKFTTQFSATGMPSILKEKKCNQKYSANVTIHFLDKFVNAVSLIDKGLRDYTSGVRSKPRAGVNLKRR